MDSRSQAQAPLRSGLVRIRKGKFASWRGWKRRWLVLTPSTLSIYKDRASAQKASGSRSTYDLYELIIADQLTTAGQQEIVLEFQGNRKLFLSFSEYFDLNSWYNDIYSNSQLSPRSAISPSDDDDAVYAVIYGYTSPSPMDMSFDLASKPPPRESKISSTAVLDVKLDLLDLDPSNMPAFPEYTQSNVFSSEQLSIIMEAISILCEVMQPRLLRKSEPGGEKPFDLVEIRLRPLSRLQMKWCKGIPAEDLFRKEGDPFKDALCDGYVLCLLVNSLQSELTLRPDSVRGHENNTNVLKFLRACQDIGLEKESIFFPDDLLDSNSESLTRVATTIIKLFNHLSNASARKLDGPNRASDLSSIVQWIDEMTGARIAKLKLQDENVSLARSSSLGSHHTRVHTSNVVARLQLAPMIYQNTLLLLQENASSEPESLQTLSQLSTFIASLDPLSGLINSRPLRIRLLQIATQLNMSDDQRLREALQKDDLKLAEIFQGIIMNDRSAVLRLRGEDAQGFVDLIQDILDKGLFQDAVVITKAQKALVKLSQARDVLPSSLFIQGVVRCDKEPIFGGTFGDIYRGTYMDEPVALKRIRVFRRDSTVQHTKRKFYQEALLWQHLRHPFVLPFRGIDAENFPSFLSMVSPWMKHGTITKHLSDHGYANVEIRLFEIAQGLDYLHSKRIIHGDLRGSNILVDDNWHACLADFGLAVFADGTASTRTSHHAGSVRWMAPELLDPASLGLRSFQRTYKSDVYSFGCVCLELYTGKAPFCHLPHDPAAMLQTIQGNRPERPKEVVIPDYMWEIIESCWKHEPTERPRMRDVVDGILGANEGLEVYAVQAPSEDQRTESVLASAQRSKTRRRRKQNRMSGVRTHYESRSF